MRARKPDNPAVRRERNYRYRYGITTKIYEDMLTAQGGVCVLCEKPPKPGQRLHVDHDHGSGRVRQLLCVTCNHGLADLENPVWYARATDYLRRHHPERYVD